LFCDTLPQTPSAVATVAVHGPMLPSRILAFAGLAAQEVSGAGPLWPTVCSPGDASSKFPFCDQTLSFDNRATDLVNRLTLDEKQSILDNGAKAVPRLGIPAYQWWSEGLHGPLEPCVSDGSVTKCPTNFPAASAMAAALNDTLYLAAGSVVGVEGRAISNLRTHDSKIGDGLTYWAPNANMERDPRWGRNQEAPGEDPLLTSKYIAHYVRGLQEGEDPDHVQMVATCKHFLANSLEHSTIDGKVITRHNFDAEIPLPELTDYYLPGFKSCVQEGRGLGIMCSYNAVNGVPMCANRDLLTNVLRDQWGFDGYVTSDCGAINDIQANHHFAPDGPTAAAMGLKAGCDNDCGGVYGGNTIKAVNMSILSEKTIDISLRRLAKIQMRLGLFEDKKGQMYFDSKHYGIDRIDTPEHQQLAYEAALQSIVLLKNEKSTLPLKRGLKLAVIGPHTYAQEALMSNYHGARCPTGDFSCITTPYQAIANANVGGTNTGYKGVDVNSGVDNVSQAVQVAQAADAVILVVGIDGSIEGEEHDRSNCTLPALQPKLVSAISALGKPTVMVLLHGGAMCLGELKEGVPAIVDAFYGGERGSDALAAVLFGEYNPSGKLPVTMYPVEYLEQNPLTQMSVTAPPGRTHLYYTGTPEFAFGTGLSYSSWGIEVLSAGQEVAADRGSTAFTVKLTNRGPMAGQQRVLAYVRPRSLMIQKTAPKQRLWAYQGVDLRVGESKVLTFALDTSMLAHSNDAGDRVVQPGNYEVAFSDGSYEVKTGLRVTGEVVVFESSVFRTASKSPVVV
jgi:beta-glucosidase-like glycosyl hydrolase